MKKKVIFATTCFVLATVAAQATETKKVPEFLVGTWCQKDNDSEYWNVSGYIEDVEERAKITKCFSAKLWEMKFNVKGVHYLCAPIEIGKTKVERAPSGTTYEVVMSMECVRESENKDVFIYDKKYLSREMVKFVQYKHWLTWELTKGK